MGILIWICLVGSAIAGVLLWAIDRFDKFDKFEKVGRGWMVLWLLVLLSPFFLVLGYGVIDMVAWVQEALVEFSEADKGEKFGLGLSVLFVLLFCLMAYVEHQVKFRQRVDRWTVILRILQKILQKVFVAFMIVGILLTLVNWAIGVVVLPMMLFRHWPDMHWYEVVGLVVCAVMFYRIIRETFWPRY